jgi:UDP-N-acetylglucosamine--N-acetylmuramyl-(pentapeptide) pyrophosphoryl-undecaprenol N-acetylglucosamine transferase
MWCAFQIFGFRTQSKEGYLLRIILSGGGTGGHINPALAIAKKVRAEDPTAEILFCGGKGGLEEKLVPREGFELKTFAVHGLRRKLTPANIVYNVKVLAEAERSRKEAEQTVRTFRPDVVVGCGGYASFPVVRAAQKCGVPTLLLEVNAFPGVTTRQLARHADAVMICFEDSRAYFPGKNVILTGSPVRPEFLNADRDRARREMKLDDRPLVVSVWGSLGAEHLNHCMPDFLRRVTEHDDWYVLHAIGSWGYTWVRDEIKAAGVDLAKHPNIDVRDYIYDMPTVMAAADLVLCRGGAATAAELAVMGKPAIIVPSPNVAENHQEKNARALEAKGGVEVILDRDVTGALLYERARAILSDPVRLQKMSDAIRSVAQPDALDRIYRCVRDAAGV